MELRYQPCQDCGSTDALTIYDDHTHCYSCLSHRFENGKEYDLSETIGFDAKELDDLTIVKEPLQNGSTPLLWKQRNISAAVMQRYDVQAVHDNSVEFPYYDNSGNKIASKHRSSHKSFYTTGNFKKAGLFGAHTLTKDAAQRDSAVIVTEGEADALAAFQMFNRVDPEATKLTRKGSKLTPALSIKSGVASAERDFRENLELLEQFDKVYIVFDSDEYGKKAAPLCARLLTPGKAFVVTLELKDACDYSTAGKSTEFASHLRDSRCYTPSGIANAADNFDGLWDEQNITSIPFPWRELQDRTYGIRSREIITWAAGTGVGKSSLLRELQHHYIKNTNYNLGIIALEEGINRTKRGILAVEANDRLHLNEVFANYDHEEIKKFYDATLGTGRVYLYDHFGSMEMNDLLNRVRYMVVGLECQIIFIDHLSILVSGMDISDERKAIDRTMTLLRQLTEETGCSIHLVTHLRRLGSDRSHESGVEINLSHLRGSHGTSQISDTVIAMERDTQADDPVEANTVTLRVLKCRYTGDVGVAGTLYYDKSTGRLERVKESF